MTDTLITAGAALLGLLVGRIAVAAAAVVPRSMYRLWLEETVACLRPQPEAGEPSLWRLAVPGQDTPADLQRAAARAETQLQAVPGPSVGLWRWACGSCDARAPAWAGAPVVGWLVLGGRCPSCQAPLRRRQPLGELAVAALFAFCSMRFGYSLQAAAWAGCCAVLVFQALIDLESQLLPDSLNYALMWGGLLGAVAGITGTGPVDALWGAALGYLGLWSLGQGHRLITGQDGMGLGDAKLLAALGAWFGAAALIPIGLLSSVIACAVIGTLLLTRRRASRKDPFAFGPFLVAAALVLLVTGPQQAQSALHAGLQALLRLLIA